MNIKYRGSKLVKRTGSSIYQYHSNYDGIRIRQTTNQSDKRRAMVIKAEWDTNLEKGDLRFLDREHSPSTPYSDLMIQYLGIIEKCKSWNVYDNSKQALTEFGEFLKSKGVTRVEVINAKLIDQYIAWLKCGPKTIKNKIYLLSPFFKKLISYKILKENPIVGITLPDIVQVRPNRILYADDIDLIFKYGATYSLYYRILLHTGLRAGDVAILRYDNIDWVRGIIEALIRKTKKYYEFPLSNTLIKEIPRNKTGPIFPSLYVDISTSINPQLKKKEDTQIHNKIEKPRNFMQAILETADPPRPPHATLHSFRHTFNYVLQKQGVSAIDRQFHLAHSSTRSTKVYSPTDIDLSKNYVNTVYEYFKN